MTRVCSSATFQKAPKLREFLAWICEQALAGRGELIREQSIGCNVFGRVPGYSVSDDNIVRVEARALRKRLDTYFEGEGAAESIVIRIPKGAYLPVFETRASHAEPIAETPPAAPQVPHPHGKKPWLLFAAGVIAVLVIAALLLANLRLREQLRGANPRLSPADKEMYREVLGPMLQLPDSKEILVALSNPRLMYYHGAEEPLPPERVGSSIIPIPQELARLVPFPSSGPTGVRGSHHYVYVTEQSYTGMGEAAAAFHVGRLLDSLGAPARLAQGRFLTWESVRSRNVVVLGSPHINAWTRENVTPNDFSLVNGGVEVRNPTAGERKLYTPTATERGKVDYAVISLVKLPSGSANLNVYGRGSTGTYGAGEFLADPAKIREFHRRIATRPFPNQWEILVRVNIGDGLPVGSEYVTHRAH